MMSDSYKQWPLKLKPLTTVRLRPELRVCSSKNIDCIDIWQSSGLNDKQLDSFVERHKSIRAYAQKMLPDFHRDFSDKDDLLVLTDDQGRLIMHYSSPDSLPHHNVREADFCTGAPLAESNSGSVAIQLALRYHDTIAGTYDTSQGTHSNKLMTVAVPLLDSNRQPLACVAIFNYGSGSLGEKLLLAKFVAHEFSRFYEDPVNTEQDSNQTSLRQAISVVSALQTHPTPLPPPTPTGIVERRHGDRRQLLAVAGAERTEVKLTPRQHQTLMLFAQGKSYKAIASEIGITSYKTVEEHLGVIREKLKVSSRRECIQKAISLGLI